MIADIRTDGWTAHCIWEHSATVRELYARRARGEAEEMVCAAQAAELLAPLVSPGDSLLDAGCGSGYFFHSLKRRGIPAEYHGIDAAPSLIAIGQRELPRHGLSADRLKVLRIEDLDGAVDHVLCMNVLSNIDNFHRPLERLLKLARKSLVLRESAKNGAEYRYVRDAYLDPGVDLSVHVNAYDAGDIEDFIGARGFRVRRIADRRSGGLPEMVIDHPHWWTFFLAERM
ncbi:MAG TPA: class I SAM-dependent methyltransferase [Stellaceae bacterium]|nr:class I SAM-dependent methyltransferase [Stellaceae bacterium]